MKNFTNNFKQFTSRLSARWLIMALMMLVGTSSAWAVKIYMQASTDYQRDNARFAAYFFDNGTTWVDMSLVSNETNVYECEIPTGYPSVIFCRMNPNATANNWDNRWNQTGNLTIPTDGKNLYVVTGYGDGSWSTTPYTPPCDVTLSVSKDPDANIYLTSEPVTLSATAENHTSITWKNGDTTLGTGDSYTYTQSEVGSASIKAIAENTTCSVEKTVDLAFVNQKAIKITTNGNYYLYTWDGDNTEYTKSWPGIKGTQEGDFYVWTIETTKPINAILNKGKDQAQTANIESLQVGYEYYLQWDGTGSASVSTDNKTELPKPCTPADVTIQDWNISTLCPGSSGTFTYTAAQGATVTWEMNENNSDYAIVSDNGTVTITYNGTSTTNSKLLYSVSGDGFCPEEDVDSKKTISTAAKPSISASTSITQAICPDDKATLSVTSDQGTYSWGSTDGGETITSTSYSVQVGTAGTYTVTATNTNGCTSDPVSFSVTVNSRPEKPILVTKSTSRCQAEESVNLNTLAGVSGVNWYDSNSELVTNGNVSITTAGTYTFTAKAVNNEGCESAEASESFTLTVKSLANASNYKLKDGKTSSDYTGSAITLLAEDITISNGAADVTRIYFKQSGSEVDAKEVGTYDVYIDTEEIDDICEGSDLKIGTFTISCQKPTSPEASSTQNVIKCGADYKQYGIITINPFNQNLTYKLNGETDITSATIENLTEGEYSITATRTCGSTLSTSDPIIVTITATDATPTITASAAVTQPNVALTLNSAAGDATRWEVSTNPNEAGSITESTGASVNFSATEIGEYVVTATNGDCSFNFTITVADAFYIWVRNAKEGETAYANFYYPDQNTEEYRGGEMFYAECTELPTDNTYTTYNDGGREADLVKNDCDGYTWYGFRASADVISGSKYFYVHAKNNKNKAGWYTHTVPTKVNLTGDVYYTLCETNVNNCNEGSKGWKIVVSASAPYSGPKVHASGSTALGTNKFAALYVTDCSGKEIDAYQWESCSTQAGTYANYKASVTNSGTLYSGDAGTTNNIRPDTDGWYRCKVTYKDHSTLTSEPVQVTGSYTYTNSSLPVFVVNTNGEGFPVNDCSGTPSKNADKMKEKVSVDVKIYKAGTMVYDRKARMNYRGSSSLNFLKKSYAFCPGKDNCVEDKGRQDYVKTEKMNMLNVGTAKDKDWVLYAAAPDPSLMRNRLVFDTFRDMTGKWSVNSCYVQLYVDGTYKGVYVLMDKITNNENRVNITHEDGFIVKFDKTDKVDRVGGYEGKLGDEKTFKTTRTGKDDIGTYDTSIDQRFEIEYPEKDDYPTGWSAKVNQIKGMFEAFENALAQGDFATVQKYIDYDSWADWFIISEYIKNVDAYRASNIFVYNGNKIEAWPLWDQELSFNNQTNVAHGSNSTTGLMVTTGSIYNNGAGDFPAPFWFTGGGANITGGLLSDPCFVQVVKEKWNQYSTGTGALTQDALNAKIEAYTTELGTAADISFNRGTMDCGSCQDGGCYSGGTGYSDVVKSTSITNLNTWIENRGNNLTTALNNLTGASFSIQIIPSEAKTTPWEPVEIAVSVTPAGYDYKLEYTDNDLGSVANTIIEEEGDKITYRIPRPSAWGAGDAEEGERTDIEYGIKATLSVQDGTTVCGSQAAPYSIGKIILQDEPNDNCE